MPKDVPAGIKNGSDNHSNRNSHTQKKILVVEDEASLRTALEDKFKQAGYKVFLTSNGKEGLAEALLQKPDLILLDLYMPLLDGTRMLENLRADDWGRRVPVVVFTNFGSSDVAQQLKKYDIAAYFTKTSITIDDLIQKIAAILK